MTCCLKFIFKKGLSANEINIFTLKFNNFVLE